MGRASPGRTGNVPGMHQERTIESRFGPVAHLLYISGNSVHEITIENVLRMDFLMMILC